ncbi:MAG: response regulator transcription factor [Bacteroidetes bacterium]|nr:response regulator transcription factor [Bacteroidota bacterium]MBS1930598.1 response regulator transcription factor [Bacteroidota bacterium]
MPDAKTIRCLVVDDEPLAREIITRYIKDVPTLQLTGECSNALEAFAVLQKQTVDLVFLDIRMPQLNGNDFLKTLKNPPKIIFITAHHEYALEGYELDVVDYLMKPVPFDRFLKAVNKAYPTGVTPISTEATRSLNNEAFVYFRVDRKMVKVMLHNVLYIESMKDYIKIFTDHTTLITKQSISSVEEMLPENEFTRVHRSYIVSLRKIRSFTAELLEVSNTTIPIGRLYRNGVLKKLE